jgi:hypothetical protein
MSHDYVTSWVCTRPAPVRLDRCALTLCSLCSLQPGRAAHAVMQGAILVPPWDPGGWFDEQDEPVNPCPNCGALRWAAEGATTRVEHPDTGQTVSGSSRLCCNGLLFEPLPDAETDMRRIVEGAADLTPGEKLHHATYKKHPLLVVRATRLVGDKQVSTPRPGALPPSVWNPTVSVNGNVRYFAGSVVAPAQSPNPIFAQRYTAPVRVPHTNVGTTAADRNGSAGGSDPHIVIDSEEIITSAEWDAIQLAREQLSEADQSAVAAAHLDPRLISDRGNAVVPGDGRVNGMQMPRDSRTGRPVSTAERINLIHLVRRFHDLLKRDNPYIKDIMTAHECECYHSL